MNEKQFNKKLKNKKAFSLMELIVVIIILGILTAFVLPNITGKSEEAKSKITCVQMRTISQALKLFKIDNSRYPTTEEGLMILTKNSDNEELPNYPKNGYFEDGKMPLDSWASKYIYTSNEDGFDIISFGANRTEGGGDDIYLSKCK